jgi:uncharacterized integral membrane protein
MARKRNDPLIWGIILIVLGLIFLLQNVDIDAWGFVARLWPLILVLWGASKLYYGLKERREQADKPQDSQ